uniref:Ovule protein n=1 Tax=Parascaris equorum TaxID=6256 RepID=A0A914SKP9_PAREQ
MNVELRNIQKIEHQCYKLIAQLQLSLLLSVLFKSSLEKSFAKSYHHICRLKLRCIRVKSESVVCARRAD